MNIEIFTCRSSSDLHLWDDDSKLPEYKLKISDFQNLMHSRHPKLIFEHVYDRLHRYWLACSISGFDESDTIVIITYQEAVFDACTSFMSNVKKYDSKDQLHMHVHVVDNHQELFVASVTSTGKMLAPVGSDFTEIFDSFTYGMDHISTEPPMKVVGGLKCSDCQYSRENYPENTHCPCFTCDEKYHTNFKRYEEFHGAV